MNGLDSLNIPLLRLKANLTISITDDDDAPLHGVEVSLNPENELLEPVSAVSDAGGHAVFSDLPVGDIYQTTINESR